MYVRRARYIDMYIIYAKSQIYGQIFTDKRSKRNMKRQSDMEMHVYANNLRDMKRQSQIYVWVYAGRVRDMDTGTCRIG